MFYFLGECYTGKVCSFLLHSRGVEVVGAGKLGEIPPPNTRERNRKGENFFFHWRSGKDSEVVGTFFLLSPSLLDYSSKVEGETKLI